MTTIALAVLLVGAASAAIRSFPVGAASAATGSGLKALLPLFAILLIAAPAAVAQSDARPQAARDVPDCTLYSKASLMSWPAEAPVWQFCWRRALNSAPQPAGSAVELFDVIYNGHRVFDRVNIPILNVEYGPGGCGCFRDWLDFEVRFEAVGSPCGDGYCEVIDPARTVCDCAPTNTCDTNPDNQCNVDLGSFTGVAAEKETDRLVMTTQMEAGWYRYTQEWTFYLDGTIEPGFGFGAIPNGCTDTTHFHHGYYRFDFDIDGPQDDEIFREVVSGAGQDSDGDGFDDEVDNCTQVVNPDQRDTDADGYGNLCDADLDNDGTVNFTDLGEMKSVFFTADANADLDGSGFVNFADLGIMKASFFEAPGPSGRVPQQVLVTSEEHDYRGDTVSWLTMDAVTGRGYRVVPGTDDQALKVTTFDPAPFAQGDYWILAEHDDELYDNRSVCEAHLDPFVDGESTEATDIVLWYRYGALHEGGDECYCGRRGPTLVPVGDWLPSGS